MFLGHIWMSPESVSVGQEGGRFSPDYYGTFSPGPDHLGTPTPWMWLWISITSHFSFNLRPATTHWCSGKGVGWMELSQRARNGQVLSGFFTFLVLAPPVVLAVMATNTRVWVTIGRPSCWLSHNDNDSTTTNVDGRKEAEVQCSGVNTLNHCHQWTGINRSLNCHRCDEGVFPFSQRNDKQEFTNKHTRGLTTSPRALVVYHHNFIRRIIVTKDIYDAPDLLRN